MPQPRPKATPRAASPRSSNAPLRIVSWNVNGIRAATKQGFGKWLAQCGADVVGLQEVRATEAQVPVEIREAPGWHTHFVSAERAGYSGVGLLSRQVPDSVRSSLDAPTFDVEGRVQMARFGKLLVVNAYFPNGKGKEGDNSRVPYKLDFYRRLFDVLAKECARKGRVLVIGDFNTAHREIDLARPRENVKVSGFLPEERAELDRWVAAGWVDTFRHFVTEPNRYSWWSRRAGSRERNVGWRIDYVFASEGAMPFITGAEIHANTLGSDHCPVSVTLKRDVLV